MRNKISKALTLAGLLIANALPSTNYAFAQNQNQIIKPTLEELRKRLGTQDENRDYILVKGVEINPYQKIDFDKPSQPGELEEIDKYERINGKRISLPDWRIFKRNSLEAQIQKPKDNEPEKIVAWKIGRTYLDRFEEFKDLFEKYSANPPKDFEQKEFMALLVAIAQKESSLGYPEGKRRNENLLMGYGNPSNRNNYGAEKQIERTSRELVRAFNGVNKLYPTSSEDPEKRLLEILSIYNTGKVNPEGMRYAKTVFDFYKNWKKEFSK